MSHPIFSNDLILENIFSFVDFATAKKMKMVSRSFAKNFRGCRNKGYLKLKDSDHKDSEAENEAIFEWALKPENSWVLKRMKIPIQEAMRSYVIKNFLESYGHKTTHLQLFLQENIIYGYIPTDYRTILCGSPPALIQTLLSSWCPNLEHLSILDNFYDCSYSPNLIEKFPQTNLKTLELIGSNFYLAASLTHKALYNLIRKSQKLIELKISHRGERFLEFLNQAQDFKSNLQNIELTTEQWINFNKLKLLNKERFPRLRKLLISNRFQEDSNISQYSPLIPIHSGVKELCWGSPRHFDLYIPILLSVFPNVETLRVKQLPRFHCSGPFNFEGSFPGVKKLCLDCDETVLFRPSIIKNLFKFLPNVENLEITELVNLKLVAKAIEGMESIKEVDLTVGETFKSWIKKEDLDRFPENIRLNIHE